MFKRSRIHGVQTLAALDHSLATIEFDPSGKIQIESTLPGFAEIVSRAAHAARENKLMVDRITADNLSAIGVAA